MPSLRGQVIRNVIDINAPVLALEGDDADHGITNDLDVLGQNWVLLDSRFKLLCGSDNVEAALDVSGLANVHQASPAARNESTGSGSRHGGRGIDTTGPIRVDEILVAAIGAVLVQ